MPQEYTGAIVPVSKASGPQEYSGEIIPVGSSPRKMPELSPPANTATLSPKSGVVDELSDVTDLLLGLPAFVAKVGATGVADLAHTFSGTPNPVAAGSKTVAEAMDSPWMKFMSAPVKSMRGETEGPTVVSGAMGKVGEYVGKAADWITEKTGNPELGEAFKQATDVAMLGGGHAAAFAFKAAVGKIKSRGGKSSGSDGQSGAGADDILKKYDEPEQPPTSTPPDPRRSFLSIPDDAAINSADIAAKLTSSGANAKEVNLAIKRNPKVEGEMEKIRERRGQAVPAFESVLGKPILNPDGTFVPDALTNLLHENPAASTTEMAARLAAQGVRRGPNGETVKLSPQAKLGLAAAAGGAGMVLAAQYPDKEGYLEAGLLGGALIAGHGKGLELKDIHESGPATPLGAYLERSANTLSVLERLPKNRFDFPKGMIEEQLRRPDVTKAEKEIFEPILAKAGQMITAKELMVGMKEGTGGFELKAKETNQFASYGLDEIGRGDASVGGDGPWIPEDATPAEEAALVAAHETQPKASTTIWQSPIELGANNHFKDPNYFAHSRSFQKAGVEHVVELQSDFAQKVGKVLSKEERTEFLREQGELEKQYSDHIANWGRPEAGVMPREARNLDRLLRVRLAEIGSKLEAGSEADPIRPMLKDWPKRIVREILARAAKPFDGRTDLVKQREAFQLRAHGLEETEMSRETVEMRKAEERPARPFVRFATADTVAKVEGWPDGRTGEYKDLSNEHPFRPEHQGIYDRYKGDIEKFLTRLGGKPYTDPKGHTWIEVPSAGSKTLPAGPRVQQFGAADPQLIIRLGATAAGAALAAHLATQDKLESALAGGAAALALTFLPRYIGYMGSDWKSGLIMTGSTAGLVGLGAVAVHEHPVLAATLAIAFGASKLLPKARIPKLGDVTIDQMVNTVRGAIAAHQREVSNVARVIRGGLTEDLRKAAAGAIEKNNFREFTPTQKKFVDAYSSFVGYVGKAAIEAGVLGDVLERYVTHLVEKEPLSKTMISDFIDGLLNPKSSGGGFKTTSPFAKGRKYPTLEELGKALEGSGLRIKTTDIADLAEVYGKSMWEAIERKRFVEALKAAKLERENGAGWVMDAKKAPSSYRTIDSAQLRGLSVHPDLAGPLRFLMEPSKLPLPLHVMRVISSAVKRNVFLGSLFHVKSLGEAAIMATGVKGLTEIGRSVGQGLGLEKHFGESAVKAALEKYRSGGPGDWVDDLIKGGLNVNHIDDMNPNALRELGRTADSFLGKFGFLEKTLGGMEDIQKKLIDELTWNYTHMGGKLAVAHHLIEGEMLRNKKLPEEEQLPEQEIVKQVATAVNNFMGGQDWFRIASEAQTQIGRELAMGTFGPAGRAIIGLVALAPDWNISTFRAVWKALPGKTEAPVTQRLSATYALRSAFFYFVIMDQVNNAMSGHHMWSKEQKDPTRVELPNGSQIQFGKHAFEVVELLHKPGQTLLAKGNPLAKLPIELAMGKEYLSSGYAPAMENPLAHIAGTVLPLSVKGAMAPYRTPEEAAKRAVLNAMGLPITGLTHEEEARRKVMNKEKSVDKKANELPETRDARERKKLLRELQ